MERISLSYRKDQDPKWANLVWDLWKLGNPDLLPCCLESTKAAWESGAITLRVNEKDLRTYAARRGLV